MANNEYVNKVEYGGNTLIDLTSDTITANKMVSGYTAHDKSGASITGTIPIKGAANIIQSWVSGTRYTLIDSGYYPDSMMRNNSVVYVPVPSSGTNTFYIFIPNGTTTPNQEVNDDWIGLTVEVDSSGNSNITDDTVAAAGVSF